MIKYCNKCGCSLSQDDLFCPECGEKQKDSSFEEVEQKNKPTVEKPKDIDEKESNATEKTAEDNKATEKKQKKKHLVLKKLAEVIGVIIIASIISNIWFIPQYIPQKIWSEDLLYDVKETMENESVTNDLGNVTVNLPSKLTSDMIDSYGEADLTPMGYAMFGFSDKKTTVEYYLSVPATVVEKDTSKLLGRIYAEIHLVTQPNLFGDSPYIRFIEFKFDKQLSIFMKEFTQNEFEKMVRIVNAYWGNDYWGNPLIGVEYEFTNTTNETVIPMTEISVSAFQNSTGLQSNYSGAEDKLKKIQPGGTITIYEEFLMNDTITPVEVVIGEYFSVDANPPQITETYNPQEFFDLSSSPGTFDSYGYTGLDSLVGMWEIEGYPEGVLAIENDGGYSAVLDFSNDSVILDFKAELNVNETTCVASGYGTDCWFNYNKVTIDYANGTPILSVEVVEDGGFGYGLSIKNAHCFR